jgi:superfamily II DNA or RNA helicase
MADIELVRVNEVYYRVECDASTLMEMSDRFTFEVPGAKFIPAVRNKMWDGKIRLLNMMTRLIYLGLEEEICKFARSRDYTIELRDPPRKNELSEEQLKKFLEYVRPKHQPRDYQLAALADGIQNERRLFLSPTASGKSLIIYLLCRWYDGKKKIIVVPTTSLVFQMASDFEEYGYKEDIHRITAGVTKDTDCQITVTTWQSIYKMPKSWFDQFDVVIGDEAHNFKAKSLTSILEKMTSCRYRFGFTGTLDGTLTNKLVLMGLFGKVNQVTTTATLMEQKHVAELKIKCVVLIHSDAAKALMNKATYQQEMDYLVRSEARNKFIVDMCVALKGNTLILFQYVEKHGRQINDMILSRVKDRKVFFVHGGVETEEREEIRKIVETENDAIIVASYGVFSTGVNIKRIHNVVFASPTKSRIRTLQSIGRGLRKGSEKDSVILYDVADDMSRKSYQNHTLKHFIERAKIYDSEKFSYKVFKYRISDDA